MKERERLEHAIAALGEQRLALGDAVVEAAIASLREKLTALNEPTLEPDMELHSGPGKVEGPNDSQHASERRVITILFCDVKGSTAMAEKLDPEEWAGIIQRAFEYFIVPVRRHRGTVSDVRGDGILAFFGAPVAHEDDPQQAVLAGLDILDGIQEYREQLQRTRGLDFNVRVGIHTGLAVVGEVGTEGQMEYTALGDTVNLAARMEQTARPGTVQISEQTYQLIQQIFECVPLGEIKVKGKRTPIRSYQVSGLKAQVGPLRGLERQGLHSHLIGREAEYAVLKGHLDWLLNGHGGIIGIIGEAGIGKSRLISEIQLDALANRLSWLEGHTLSYGQTIPYWPFQEILRHYCEIYDEDSEAVAWSKLENRVGALFSNEKAEILPYLARLMALQADEEWSKLLQFMDAEALGKQLFLVSRRFFQRLAQENPLVLVFEDIHWMDESSSRLLEHLLPLVESDPLLILGVSRPYHDTPAAHLHESVSKKSGQHYTEIRLEPLSNQESIHLFESLLKIQNIPSHLSEAIVSKADGNPFFLEEIIRTLIETGAVGRDPAAGGWRIMDHTSTLTIPNTVQGVLMARIDLLDEEIKHVLRLAAVIGRTFLYNILKAIADETERLENRLEELTQIELILVKKSQPELEYLFKHALAQEATYESILLQKRREIHDRVGQAIESLFSDRLEEFYGLLAYHYAKAEAWEKAQDYMLRAGDQAGRIAADTEALAYYHHAIEAYARAFGGRWDPIQWAALERKIGEAHWRRGEYSQAFEHLNLGLHQLGRTLPSSRSGIRLGILNEGIQQVLHRLMPPFFLADRPAEPSPGVVEEVLIYECITWMDATINPERFLLGSLRELNTSEKHGYQQGVMMASTGLGVAADFNSIYSLAEMYHRRAVQLAGQNKNPIAAGLAYYGMMIHLLCLGKWESANNYAEKSAEAYRQVGDLHGYLLAALSSIFILTQQGHILDSFVRIPELIEQCREADDRLSLALGLIAQGFIESIVGRAKEAAVSLQKAVDLAKDIPDHLTYVMAMGELGHTFIKMGKIKEAIDTFEINFDFSHERQLTAGYILISTYNGMAEALLLAAEQGDEFARAGWMRRGGKACRAALKHGRIAPGGMPEALRLQGRYEWIKGNAARAQRWWNKSLAEAEMLGMPYELGLTHLEMSQRMGDRTHLEQAETIFDSIGAAFDLARTRDLPMHL